MTNNPVKSIFDYADEVVDTRSKMDSLTRCTPYTVAQEQKRRNDARMGKDRVRV